MYRRGAMSTEGQVQACVVKFKTAPKWPSAGNVRCSQYLETPNRRVAQLVRALP